jgi:hypothetical protein
MKNQIKGVRALFQILLLAKRALTPLILVLRVRSLAYRQYTIIQALHGKVDIETGKFCLPLEDAQTVGEYLDHISSPALNEDSIERLPFSLFGFSKKQDDETEEKNGIGLGLALTGLLGGAGILLAALKG